MKTVVLAGINSVTLWDPKNVSVTDSLSALFTPHALNTNRAISARGMVEILNPMVKVYAHNHDVHKLMEADRESLKTELARFTAVVLADHPKSVAVELNALIREITGSVVVFYYAGTVGKLGFGFVDAGKEHKFHVKEKKIDDCDLDEMSDEPVCKKAKVSKSNENEILKEKTISFVPLASALKVKAGKAGAGLTKRTNPMFIALHVLFKFYEEKQRFPKTRVDDHEDILRLEKEVLEELGLPEEPFIAKLRELYYERYVYGEYASITTIVGGVLGQDLIRSVTHQASPIRNFFLFWGHKLRGHTESFGR